MSDFNNNNQNNGGSNTQNMNQQNMNQQNMNQQNQNVENQSQNQHQDTNQGISIIGSKNTTSGFKTTQKFYGKTIVLTSGELKEFWLVRNDKQPVQLFAYNGEVELQDGTKVASTVEFDTDQDVMGDQLGECLVINGETAQNIQGKRITKLRKVLNPKTMQSYWNAE